MALSNGIYGGGQKVLRCPLCDAVLWNKRPGKCHDCAIEIAKKVAKDFKENIGHHYTEAVLATETELIPITETPLKIEDKSDKD